MTDFTPQPRREFLRRSSQSVLLLGAAGSLGSLGNSSQVEASSPPVPREKRASLIATGAGRARKIAVGPQDQIYVAADANILIFDASGEKQQTIKLPRPARCLAVNRQGRIYAGLLDRVLVMDAHGKELSVWNSASVKSIYAGIAVSEDEVFIADAGTKRIWRINFEGELLGIIHGKNGFTSPAEFFSVQLGSGGSVRVVNSARHQIESYRTTGEFVSSWGERSRGIEGFSGCCNPVSFVELPNGNYITAERGQPRVKLYNPQGQFQKLIAGPEQFALNAKTSNKDNSPGCTSGGLDVAMDSTGAALVLDRVTGHIHRFVV